MSGHVTLLYPSQKHNLDLKSINANFYHKTNSLLTRSLQNLRNNNRKRTKCQKIFAIQSHGPDLDTFWPKSHNQK